MKENNIKINHILFMILTVAIVLVVGTYSWLTYRSKETAMVLTIGEINNIQVSLSPYQIKASLSPQVTYTSDNYTSVTIVNNSGSSKTIRLFYAINNIDNELISSDFKYTIEISTDGGTNYIEYLDGDFSSASNGNELTILQERIPANANYYYKVYLWINGDNNGQNNLQAKSFDGELRAQIFANENKQVVKSLKEQTESELFTINSQYPNITVSEKIDKLKENNILNNDMTFKNNNNYRFTYNGNIIDSNNDIVDNVTLYNNYNSYVMDPPPSANVTTGTKTVIAIDGTIRISKINNTNSFGILQANEPPAGYKFAYWIDQNDNIFTYLSYTDFYVITDMIFTAVYVKESETIVPQFTINIYGTNQTTASNLQFHSTFTKHHDTSDYEIYVGILATNNIKFANETYMVYNRETNTTNQNELFYNRVSAKSNAYQFSYIWGKSNVGLNSWYARGYIKIINKNTNEVQAYYSPNIILVHK